MPPLSLSAALSLTGCLLASPQSPERSEQSTRAAETCTASVTVRVQPGDAGFHDGGDAGTSEACEEGGVLTEIEVIYGEESFTEGACYYSASGNDYDLGWPGAHSWYGMLARPWRQTSQTVQFVDAAAGISHWRGADQFYMLANTQVLLPSGDLHAATSELVIEVSSERTEFREHTRYQVDQHNRDGSKSARREFAPEEFIAEGLPDSFLSQVQCGLPQHAVISSVVGAVTLRWLIRDANLAEQLRSAAPNRDAMVNHLPEILPNETAAHAQAPDCYYVRSPDTLEAPVRAGQCLAGHVRYELNAACSARRPTHARIIQTTSLRNMVTNVPSELTGRVRLDLPISAVPAIEEFDQPDLEIRWINTIDGTRKVYAVPSTSGTMVLTYYEPMPENAECRDPIAVR